MNIPTRPYFYFFILTYTEFKKQMMVYRLHLLYLQNVIPLQRIYEVQNTMWKSFNIYIWKHVYIKSMP